jgi:hypothetical protein
MVLKVSVHSWLVMSLLGLWRGTTSWQKCTVKEATHLTTAVMQKKRKKGTRIPISPLRAHSQQPKFLSLGPYLLEFPPPPNSTTGWRLGLQHTDLWDIQDPNHSTLHLESLNLVSSAKSLLPWNTQAGSGN